MRRLLPLLLVPLGAAGLAACGLLGGDAPSPSQADATPAGGSVTAPAPADDTVAVPVYFRTGQGSGAHLERVTRSVGIDQDLPRRALEFLVAGPSGDEPKLHATLPVTTQVRSIEVRGGTAHVVLSPEAIHDAALVGDSPANEALALAAVANTLTDFPSVERVALRVEGQGIAPGEFWGGWGLPRLLVRDEALVGVPGNGEGVPELGRFSVDRQRTGSGDATAVTLTNVRVKDRLTHVRVTAELRDPEDPDANARVPRVRARAASDGIVVDLTGIDGLASEVGESHALALSDPAFHELRVEHGERHSAIRILVDDARERPFWLHSLSGPTRIVLDVKK